MSKDPSGYNLSDKHLEDFHKCYISVAADKAGNYYRDVLSKQFDTCNGISPQTYVSCSTHDEQRIYD